jgi:hypothetical protein
MSKNARHDTKDICPICLETFLQHVHCSNTSCRFLVTTCPKCDREQAVHAFVVDHEEDCLQTAPFLRQSAA